MEVLPTQSTAVQDIKLRQAAQELEAGFLAEMLKSAGVGATPNEFGGGAGEDHFGSFLRMEQAKLMSEQGGLGLAEAIFNSLKEKQNESL